VVLFIEGTLLCCLSRGLCGVVYRGDVCGVLYRGDFVVLFIEGTLWCCL
jgi:hypothetical protein